MDKGEGQLLEAAALLVGDRVDNWGIRAVEDVEAGVEVEEVVDEAFPRTRWQIRAGWSPLR